MGRYDPVIKHANAWLLAHGKTEQWLAGQLDVSEVAVSQMLTGEGRITPETVADLARALNVPARELMQDASPQLSVQIRGKANSRQSRQAVEDLLFEIEDYLSLSGRSAT